MADYNIYIHAIGTGGATNENPTIPWGQKDVSNPTVPWSESQSSGGGFNGLGIGGAARAAALFSNPDSLVGTAISKAMKFVPTIAAAFVVVKTMTKVYETALDFSNIQSGDYGTQINYDNTRQGLHAIFTPVNTLVQIERTKLQNQVDNQRRRGNRELLGDSVINSYTNRGV